MRERLDRRVLGAIRWVDAVTTVAVDQPLVVTSSTAILSRNLSGLSIITAVPGLEKYPETFDLATLPAADLRADESVSFSGEVYDPAGAYLPRKFTVKLPRLSNATFKPIDLGLLPAPGAKLMTGWAQVRVAVTSKTTGRTFPNVLVRVIGQTDGAVLGRGMSDERGEALAAVAGLPLFRDGPTPASILTSETTVRFEFIPPPQNAGGVVDWTVLDTLAPVAANVKSDPPPLKAGGTLSLTFSVTPPP